MRLVTKLLAPFALIAGVAVLLSGDAGAQPQFGGKGGQPLKIALRPTIFDCDVATLRQSRRIEPLAECRQDEAGVAGRETAEEPNHRHRTLLRARRERPRGRRATD